jgi:hypothetical protein
VYGRYCVLFSRVAVIVFCRNLEIVRRAEKRLIIDVVVITVLIRWNEMNDISMRHVVVYFFVSDHSTVDQLVTASSAGCHFGRILQA